MPTLQQKIEGAVYGQAIGDAMGAPVETWPSQRIAERFEDVKDFLPVTHNGDPSAGKGAGRVTDDTLMMEALIHAYAACGDHMDAYDYETYLIPEIAEKTMWVPERQADIPLLERLAWAEKYPWIRLMNNHVEPRSAGIGNVVNCGAAMYIMPVGAVNAGDPHGAYQEAASFVLAHNESYSVEAAAVLAAAAAAAFGEGSTIDKVLTVAKTIARDGTRTAIEAVWAASDPQDDIQTFIQKTRQAIDPYNSRTPHAAEDNPMRPYGINDYGRPSRLHAIEELPIALGALKYGAGDFAKTLHAGVFYGIDCDSIAGMAGMLYGAVYGVDTLPQHLREKVNVANRRDYTSIAQVLYQVTTHIIEKDNQRFAKRQEALRQT